MHPRSILLVALLVVLSQCQIDTVQREIQILNEIFQNEAMYNSDDGCQAVTGSIDSCVNCYPCGHEVIEAVRPVNEIKSIRIRMGPDCNKDPYLNLCCYTEGQGIGTTPDFQPRLDSATCGMRQSFGARLESRLGVLDTDDTLFGEYPWVVAIMDNCEGGRWHYRCAGTLINSRAVLTAAHCVCGLTRRKCTLRVRAGEHHFDNDEERFDHVEVDVQRVIKHNMYYDSGLHNDIALLILKNPIEPKPHIGFACLADSNMKPDPTQNCIVAGWGVSGKGRRRPTHRAVMRSIKMLPVEGEKCQNQLRTGQFGTNYKLHESFRCAIGVEGKTILRGDGGAALICPLTGEQDRYVQYGIVSRGNSDGLPSLFTDVTKFRHWVDQHVDENIKDTVKDSYVINI